MGLQEWIDQLNPFKSNEENVAQDVGACKSVITSRGFVFHKHFSFQWKGAAEDSGPYIVITDARNQKNVWQTIPSKAFVRVGCTPPDIEHFYFGYKITTPSFTKLSSRQTITSVTTTSANEVIVVLGQLSDEKETFNVPYRLSFSPSVDAHRFKIQCEILEKEEPMKFNRTFIVYHSEDSEAIFGFGQQFPRSFNQKGNRIPILVSEQGLGRGLQPLTWYLNQYHDYAGGNEFTTYAPIPHYITSSNRSVLLENREFSIFDLQHHDRIQIEVAALKVDMHIFSGDSPLDIIEKYTAFTGRMRVLPEWVSDGAICGTQGGRSFVESCHKKLQHHRVPVAAFWLQDWVGNRSAPWGTALCWNWETDEEKYPNWKEFVHDLKTKDNVRVLSYVNSHVGDLQNVDHPVRRNLFQEAVNKGYAVKDKHGKPLLAYQKAIMFDLSNPDARVWVKDMIKTQILASGVSGYMCDFGESLPLDAALYDGDAREYHNRYPEEWAKVNQEAIDEAGCSDEIMYFMRAGFTFSPQYTSLFWLGDQLQSWDEYDGMKSAVFGATIGGLSGITMTHADIGGYNYVEVSSVLSFLNYTRTKEMFLRGCEFAAFTTAFRTHDGTRKEKSWQFYSDDETLQFFGHAARIFVAWKFYRLALIREASAKGYPVMRHMYLNYPHDPNVIELHFQYMLGTELLVAPVCDPQTTKVQVYLPEGTWVHLWTNDVTFEGPKTVDMEAPLGKPCVFYPHGSVVGQEFKKNLDS